ncbi:hypothetical protein [Mycoplasma todarodis]|uniref:Aldose epimerase n=1 Tax=Mycoplasma todarodis TaxID=1937191 RepID=A0A4R0XT52_9MOLU|nr:hypothetical protein [Mycoplasma todarodis]TCG10799.1 hypothetical protein C4B25_02990 [Mycoplasma todarodis]
MKLNNKNIEIELNSNAEVKSIKFKGIETLYQADGGWQKRFPIIFPSLGFSKGFEFNGKKYDMPKHGFWKDLEWETFFENGEMLSVATLLDTEKFPFMMDITQRIGLEGDTLYINYELANLSKEDAFFQFGIHPAFKIQDTSYITNIPETNLINLEGMIEDKQILIEKLPLKALGFGKDYDTLIAKDIKDKELNLVTDNLTLNFKFDSPHVQVWKPKDDNFICIEPWYGTNDSWYDAPADITKKDKIIELKRGMIWSATFELSFKENKKAK